MPELPEVETVVRGLREPLAGRTITGVWLDWPNSLVVPGVEEFQQNVVGQTFRRLWRRGKYIMCDLSNAALIIHLKMTGRLYVVPDEVTNEADRWVHFRFQLDNGHQLRFSDARKFGRVYLTPDPDQIVSKLGPEPLDDAFTLTVFQERLAQRKGVLKPLLLNQSFIAGIGNIYADESLFHSGIHPLRTADTLTADEQTRLHGAIRKVLQAGIDHEGASINWYRKPDGSEGKSQKHFFAYGRGGEPCHTCGTPIERIVVGSRSTHYCPTCQPRRF